MAILSQPVDAVGAVGDTVMFSVDTENVGEYRWQIFTGGTWQNTNLPGFDGPTLTVAITEARLGYQYRVRLDTAPYAENYLFSAPVHIVSSAAEVGERAKPDVFDGSPVSVSWQTEAGTVYGGTLVYSGNGTWRLVVTHKQIVFDGSRNWLQTQDSSPWYYIYLEDIARGLHLDDPCVISDWLPQANSGNMPFFRHSSSAGAKNIHLKNMELVDESIVDVASLKSYLAQHPLTIVYAVDTDNSYDLTADDVLSLLGENHVWADTGDVEVVFRADPTLYIDNKISSSIVDAIEGAY